MAARLGGFGGGGQDREGHVQTRKFAVVFFVATADAVIVAIG